MMKPMNRIAQTLLWISLFLLGLGIIGAQQPAPKVPEYHRAKHGLNGGHEELVDLSTLPGFDQLKTLDDIAAFAAKVPGATGFTAHPRFENGNRYARAIIWYTNLSDPRQSWPIYLFEKSEAEKLPGAAPRPAAPKAAEAFVQSRVKTAQELIAAAGPEGVELGISGDHAQEKLTAYAVIQLGGVFKHSGQFRSDRCIRCRNVVTGGNPGACGLGVLKVSHWNCCGGDKDAKHCRYWELLKAKEEKENEDKKPKNGQPVSSVPQPARPLISLRSGVEPSPLACTMGPPCVPP